MNTKTQVAPSGNLPKIGAPATRALNGAGYQQLEQLTKVSTAELLKLHGMGPKAIGMLREALAAQGLAFWGEEVAKPNSAPPTRTIESYLEAVTAKTGKIVDDFRQMAADKGIKKTSQLVKWLSEEYGLGYHEAGAINYMLFHAEHAASTADEKLAYHFTGNKAVWREVCDTLIAKVLVFGEDVEISPNTTYINLQRNGKKFALLQTSASRLDIGIKRKGAEPTERFEPSGKWNAMVTHRVRVNASQEIDAELLKWLELAYIQAK